ALAGGAVSRRAENDLVAIGTGHAIGKALHLAVAEPGLGASDGLEKLGAGRTRGADDVVVFVPPVRGPRAAARVGITGGADCGEQLLGRGHAQAEAERPVAIVGVEPVVA